jgi:hypothetical protein
VPAAPTPAADAAPAASAPAKSGTTANASTSTSAAGDASGAAAGTQLAGSAGPVDAADNPIGADAKKPAPQGIAIGEPNPSGGRIGTTAILTPCRQEFMTLDANGDGWLDTLEWNHAGKADADFKAKDKDANGQLDNGEYGCQDSAPGGVAPTGKG